MNKKIAFAAMIAAATTAQFFFATNARAQTSITVPNYSFEIGASGSGTGGTPADWTGTGPGGTATTAAGEYTSASGITPENGSYLGLIYGNNNGLAESIASSSPVTTITLGDTYTLTVYVALPASNSASYVLGGTANIGLYDSNTNTLLASATGLGKNGSFTAYSISYTATSANAGDGLGITLGLNTYTVVNNNSYPQVDFDNVGLTFAVPEPSTWIVLATGLGCLLLVAKRRCLAC